MRVILWNWGLNGRKKVYTERQSSIPIISCRQATKAERKVYEQS
ncbi:hypothetical protein [Nostoc sp.]